MSRHQHIIPLDRHADITEDLKIACTEQYNRVRMAWGEDFRSLELASTLGMDKPFLQKIVSFLTVGKIDYDHLVASHKSPHDDSFWKRLLGGAETITASTHAEAMMDLRRLIAERDSLPWLEDHVHFWQEFDAWTHDLDADEYRTVDNFFKLLGGKSYSSLTEEHRLALNSNCSSHAYEHAMGISYVFCEDVDRSLREDCATARYAVDVSEFKQACMPGAQTHGYNRHRTQPFDVETIQAEFIRGHAQRLHPELKKNVSLQPGVRGKSLEEVLTQAFKKTAVHGRHKNIIVTLMGNAILSGYLTESGFTVKDVVPTFTMNKTSILNQVMKAEEQAGFDTRLDDFLSQEIGL